MLSIKDEKSNIRYLKDLPRKPEGKTIYSIVSLMEKNIKIIKCFFSYIPKTT